ncbi:TetR/AcrR family transcriptional regulator [Chryseobacterium sp. R2A-55]|uniref:TetR/AcrR family transcriptional regulator n=1 Tax=Chryseobacterium sp. R2A-55 TaxID=2744445 RepID=UPI001F25AD1C|nr:TetR/AcrR family transcriptional regulator [Chryseobacterium sp. R2A-55]
MKTFYQTLSKRQQQIFDISVQLFYENGFAETSVRDIAEKLNIMAASLYSHISSKEQILEWIAKNYVGLLEAELVDFNSKERSFENQMRFMIRQNITLIGKNLEMAEIFRRYFNSISKETKERYNRFIEAYAHHLSDALKHFQIDKKLDLDAGLIAKFLMYNMNYAYKWTPENYKSEQIIDFFENKLLQKLLSIKLSP